MNVSEIIDREGLVLASNNKRILAYGIDDLIVSLIIFVSFYEHLMSLTGNAVAMNSFVVELVAYIFTLKVAYHTIFTFLYGASIGKIICKIKIIRIDTLDKPNFIYSLARSFIRIISESLFYLPLLFAFADRFKRALHDIFVKSIVIDVSIHQNL